MLLTLSLSLSPCSVCLFHSLLTTCSLLLAPCSLLPFAFADETWDSLSLWLLREDESGSERKERERERERARGKSVAEMSMEEEKRRKGMLFLGLVFPCSCLADCSLPLCSFIHWHRTPGVVSIKDEWILRTQGKWSDQGTCSYHSHTFQLEKLNEHNSLCQLELWPGGPSGVQLVYRDMEHRTQNTEDRTWKMEHATRNMKHTLGRKREGKLSS